MASNLHEVSVNSLVYPALAVSHELVSQWPEKIVIGDVTKDSGKFLSTWSDIVTGGSGLGVYKLRPQDKTSRIWYSTAETRYPGMVGRRPRKYNALTTTTLATITDNFNRNDSTTTMGATSSGHSWVALAGTWGILSNQGYHNSTTNPAFAGFTTWNGGRLPADVDISATLTRVAASLGLFIRYTNTSNYIRAYYTGSAVTLDKVNGGVVTQLGTYAHATDPILKVTASVNTIKVYVNGTERISVTDSFNSTATTHGLYSANAGAQNNSTWETFSLSEYTSDVAAAGGIAHNYLGNKRAYFFLTNRMILVDNTSDGSGTMTQLRILTDVPTDICEFMPTSGADSGLLQIYVAYTTGIDRTNTGASWSSDTTDALQLEVWDNRLWLIDATGNLKYSADGGATGWTADAVLGGVDGTYRFITSMFVAKKYDGTTALYVTTNDGLWRHNSATVKFEGPLVSWPAHSTGGRGSGEIRGDADMIAVPVGMDIYTYTPGQPAVVGNIGPNQDDGLPTAVAGEIHKVLQTSQFTAAMSERLLLAWLGKSPMDWHVLDAGATSGTRAQLASLFYIDAWSTHRIYYQFQQNNSLDYQQIFPNLPNPRQNPTTDFEISTQAAQSYWFPGALEDLQKVALKVHFRAVDVDADDYITVQYRTNLDDVTSTTLTSTTFSDGQIDAAGHGHFTFDVNADGKNEGLPFEYIKFVVNLPTGADTTKNPHLEYLTLEYLQQLPASWLHTVLLDLSQTFRGRSPQQMYDELRSLGDPATTTTLVPFVRSPDTSSDTYMVKLFALKPQAQESGDDPRGLYLATFLEPIVP